LNPSAFVLCTDYAECSIRKGFWYRYIHDSWENADGWRTDVTASVLENPEVKRALFILDDGRGVSVEIEDLRSALKTAKKRWNGKIPFNVNPHSSTIAGVKVEMRVVTVPKKEEPNGMPATTGTAVTPRDIAS